MSLILTQALPVISIPAQAHVYYQWLRFCCQFTVLEANGNWSSETTGSNGIISIASPTHFYTSIAAFVVGDVGKYIAVRDATNPINTIIGKIMSFVSTTEIVLDTSVLFKVNSTLVNYVIFDTVLHPPSTSDYFVIENTVTTQPRWHLRCVVNAAPATVMFQFGPIGGWNSSAHSWSTSLYSNDYYMFTTIARMFCVADPEQGWFFTWAEESGSFHINAVWTGSLFPFHSAQISGVPQDESYAAIFGTAGSYNASNVSRNTTIANNFCVGECLSSINTMIPLYMGQKRLLSSCNDTCSFASIVNPRSSESDDYDIFVFHRMPHQTFRGKLQGVRLCNDNIPNRTLISSGTCYSILNGIGSVWNSKVAI